MVQRVRVRNGTERQGAGQQGQYSEMRLGDRQSQAAQQFQRLDSGKGKRGKFSGYLKFLCQLIGVEDIIKEP